MLSQIPARRCLTAAGILIRNNQVLLIHHKKLNLWLPPGGHVDPNELPHQAAIREFYEETGVTVTVIPNQVIQDSQTEYLPNPLATNLHWISEANYQTRLSESIPLDKAVLCEQHLTFIYLLARDQTSSQVDLKPDLTEVHDCRWFSLDEIQSLATTPDIKEELRYAFSLSIKRPA